jgi:hypothetical protein
VARLLNVITVPRPGHLAVRRQITGSGPGDDAEGPGDDAEGSGDDVEGPGDDVATTDNDVEGAVSPEGWAYVGTSGGRYPNWFHLL